MPARTWGETMPDVYLGVGHGVKPGGGFDPGAQAPSRNEYELNWQVVSAIATALKRSNVTFHNEQASGKGHDPNFVGAAVKANQLDVKLAIEVHHNASDSHRGKGCEMLIHPQTGEQNRKLGRRIAALLHRDLGLDVRHGDGLKEADFGFLRRTDMPAIMPEVSFIDNPTDRKISGRSDYATKAGEAIARAVSEHLGKPFVPPGSAGPVSAASTLLAPPRSTEAKVQTYLLGRPHGGYSDAKVKTIAHAYFTVAAPVGLDPLVAVSQMILETANLSSFWSQPPRHNMAGVGVTGAPGVGISFASPDAGIRAQLGRLLAYALKQEQGTAAQRKLVDEALKVRPLPATLRGSAPILGGLAGRWAADPLYAEKIARIANEIA
jgi:N-acetylmuramoyl-L-alanine amidase/Mannosyl-glycoprotein endo-beta-N-acetylglucosaminidase